MNIPSRYLEKAVDEIGRLPGIGKKTALRLALHVLDYDEHEVRALSEALLQLKEKVLRCSSCGNLSDKAICEICENPHRNKELVCVVEDIRDVMAIENTGQYRGIYHVLGGVISPMEGIGPSDLNIQPLLNKVTEGSVKELIFGLGTTMEGETTTFYLYKKLAGYQITLSSIARGIAMGDQLEYADEVTLARSIANRVPYEASLKQ
jgi:recombination protein RecR